jgi:hypothetical protein
VRLGLTRAELQELLGSPADPGGTSRRHRTPATWTYGDVAFYVDRGSGRLGLIHVDTFAKPNGGSRLALGSGVVLTFVTDHEQFSPPIGLHALSACAPGAG